MTENKKRTKSARFTPKLGLGILALLMMGIIAFALPNSAIADLLGINRAQAAGGMICSNGPNFSLETTVGYASVPDGNSLFMWVYTNSGSGFQLPSPTLCVTEGQTVTISLTNNLPEPVSIIFPGQSGVTATGGTPGLLTNEAPASGGTVTYSFVAGEPGTYIYESGTNPQKQVHMGLYGALVVRPSLGSNYAYNDPDTEFGDEYLLVLHEIDNELHYNVEHGLPYDVTTRHDRYWTINGRAMPDTLADNFAPWLPQQPYSALVTVEASANANSTPALIRYVNAGSVNHPFHPHGNHLRVIAKDGRQLVSGGTDLSIEAFTKSISAGQTMDLLFRWVDVEAWSDPGNQIPITIDLPVPGLQNIVFKDAVTFFSGDYYLGDQGELPVGVTSFNECGEFYFPWHSHALNEVQNFDEGFGGMMTLVRVEPPGGC